MTRAQLGEQRRFLSCASSCFWCPSSSEGRSPRTRLEDSGVYADAEGEQHHDHGGEARSLAALPTARAPWTRYCRRSAIEFIDTPCAGVHGTPPSSGILLLDDGLATRACPAPLRARSRGFVRLGVSAFHDPGTTRCPVPRLGRRRSGVHISLPRPRSHPSPICGARRVLTVP